MDWFGKWGKRLMYFFLMIFAVLAAAVIYTAYVAVLLLFFFIYLAAELLECVVKNLKWLALIIVILVCFIGWLWVIGNCGFEGNGNGEMLKMLREMTG